MVLLVFLHLFLAVPALAAPEVPQSFKSLHHIPVSGGFANIYVDKAKVRIVNKPVNQNDSDDILVCELLIDTQRLKLIYSMGDSDDSTFIFTAADGKEIGRFNGTTLYMPGGSSIYISGWSNTMFDERRKYTFSNGKFNEVTQPYKYVGLKTTVKRPEFSTDTKPVLVSLYSDQSKSKTVAKLPEGSEIEVLLADGETWYLVRSSFGLVGWVEVPIGAMSTTIGVYFAGD